MKNTIIGTGKFAVVILWKDGQKEINKFATEELRDAFFNTAKNRSGIKRIARKIVY